MPSQSSFLNVPDVPPYAVVPGAFNLTYAQLSPDMIVTLATKGQPFAQTTLGQLSLFLQQGQTMTALTWTQLAPVVLTGGSDPLLAANAYRRGFIVVSLPGNDQATVNMAGGTAIAGHGIPLLSWLQFIGEASSVELVTVIAPPVKP